MKAEPASKQSSAANRVRGPYASQACDSCRRKKMKCDEVKPVCGRCYSSKRASECSWTGDNVRGPRTEAHFEALRKRVENLEHHQELLLAVIKRCCDEHGGDYNQYLQLTSPLSAEHQDAHDEPLDEDGEPDPVQELAVSAENLKLEDRELIFYGNAAIFRFAPQVLQTSRFPEIIENPNARYVLLVDGVNEAFYNPDLDWSRYLPAVQLTRREHDKILDLLFKFFTSWCLRVVPDLFLRDMYRSLSTPESKEPPRTPHYSPMLHNALVALAMAFSDDPRLNDIKAREQFAATAKGYLEEDLKKPNIAVVQALSLLGSFHSSKGDNNLGWLFFGMSTRVAEILGLSIDCSKLVKANRISRDDMLDRNWAHWTSYSLDVCWSLYVGRDCVVPSDGQGIPVPFVDSQFDEMPWHYPPANIPPQPSYLSRTFASTCELLVICRRLMEVVNGLRKPHSLHTVSDEVISKIDLQLNTWKGNLPPEVDLTFANRNTATPHKLSMHLIYMLAFILLHRPFMFHRKTRPIYASDKEIDHVKLCKRSAENTMDLLAIYQRRYGLRYVNVTLFQSVFSAGVIFLMLAVQAANGTRVAKTSLMTSLSQVELCIRYLREIGRSWQCATNISEILSKLLEEQLRPLLEKNSVVGIHVSPPPSSNSPDSDGGQSIPSRGSTRPRSLGSAPSEAIEFRNNYTSAFPAAASASSYHSAFSATDTSPNTWEVAPTSAPVDPSMFGMDYEVPNYMPDQYPYNNYHYIQQEIGNLMQPMNYPEGIMQELDSMLASYGVAI
ncbi:hypothetical protein C8J56DRAFT_453389 [Mycena floridula]|nr:hypothetical protein C8J56DRAFT_453389 [Mycena floridula]